MKADEVRSQAIRDEVKGWFTNTLVSRLNDKQTGRIVSIQQRLHEDDLPAMLIERGYEHLNLPAIAWKEQTIPLGQAQFRVRRINDLLNPGREDRALLDQMRRELGPAVFSAQYMQDPVAPEGNLLRMEWFGSYEDRPPRNSFIKVVQSWDTGMTAAPTSDYSVGTTWGFCDQQLLLLDVYRERLDYPDLKRAVIRLWRQWQVDKVVIENAGSGKSLAQDFRAVGPVKPLLWSVTDGKEERFIGCLAEVEAGHFLLPKEAPWLDVFRSELRAFPSGRYDDQVDSTTQFIKFQQRNWKWALTTYDANGRASQHVTLRKRPY